MSGEVMSDAPLPYWRAPEQHEHAVKAAGLALFQLTVPRLDGDDDHLTDQQRAAVDEARALLPGGFDGSEPPGTAEGVASSCSQSRGPRERRGDPGDLQSALLRVAHAALSSVRAASPSSAEFAALRRIRSAHYEAVNAAFMADALGGRLRDAPADMRDALAAAQE